MTDDLAAFIAFTRARLLEDETDIGPSLSTTYYCDEQNGVHLPLERALREIESKRAILAEHAPSEVAPDACRRCKSMAFPCRTVRVVGAIWDGHPDYRAEWKP